MDEKLFRILKKVYYKKDYIKDEKGNKIRVKTGDVFDLKSNTRQYSIENLSPEEVLYLQESGFVVNDIVYDTHDDNIHKLKEIIGNSNLTLHNVLSAYIAGFGSFPRGRQPIMSYLFARAVPLHHFCNSQGRDICEICTIKRDFWSERGKEIFRRYWGYSWNEFVDRFYIDLEEFVKLPPRTATEEDLQIFRSVIDMIRNAPEDETPGQLEQRIKKSKLIPNCEKYRLRGQLMTLAELGVMYNPFIKPLFDGFTNFNTRCEIGRKVPGSSRSDIILPLSGWRGKYGVCEERFEELFGSFYRE
ncbi:MAG: hypothetical protein HDQ98_03970 [Lachnospiraceae bacterium]|nr:hypothetical protein [Lachnospiraceae bacterium]